MKKKKLSPLIQINNDNPIPNHNLKNFADVSIHDKKIRISIEELEFIAELGKGCYGIVEKRKHRPSENVFAVKIIRNETGNDRPNRLLNDLKISHMCTECPYIVNSYCALLRGGDIWICMELMDTSLDILNREKIPKGEFVTDSLLAYFVFCIVSGLSFLHSKKVIHRDVKPSNVLLDRKGRVQLCDFGISGFLVNSKVKTNVGTRLYLAPERMNNGQGEYTVKADVWSLGVTVVEVASRKYPFKQCVRTMEHITTIVDCQSLPTIPEEGPYCDEARLFVAQCLVKDPEARAAYKDLLVHQWLMPLQASDCVSERQSLCGQSVTTWLQG